MGDLEQVLREKEGEIVYLRDTLEQNEQVIFRVYEEKEKTWEREIRKIKVKAFESIPLFTVFFSTVPLHVNSHQRKFIYFPSARVCMRRSLKLTR